MSNNVKNFFNTEEEQKIKQSIMNAELDTSGEIRIHLDNNCPGDPRDQAAYIFDKLKMQNTEHRNGVLIYLAVKNRKFAVIGDHGINSIVPDNFWDGVKYTMLDHFRKNEFVDGLSKAITLTGQQLQKHFPYKHDDINELSDDISYGKN
ncbi:MAG: TPM domain-containing protein [Bacteroidota bacterium]|nr:TPM domain-containing protein [Bacteroidota bacterium]